ncbi:MAG: DUF3768 domain-containing protein [Bradyrhizobium sp.]|uniref:DUF3768 domain-containing protein n=1 Tax=Bradyrhizobium sp. TaxID=376 RepID=UPI001A26C5D1|nr:MULTISPECIES: DUF3768 domain-containing protein [Bradyrhizobium]MBJ7403552.1 DUF3768 domain-containing protein [Bradyrhizobium sp.]MBR0926297.1 DUF3768 domain-containing protein [Bradyrhizobium diazoefficiens]
MLNDTNTATIRSLNDGFRRNLVFGGTVLLTQGVTCLEPDRVAELLEAVRTFDSFTPDNDPHGEHDFGAIDQNAVRYFWKIDYYDLSKKAYSPDPANSTVTQRVMTIMRANEY